MPSPQSTRLERALELFLEHQETGGDWQLLLARHPDLADVLASFVEEPAAANAADGDYLGDFRLVRLVGRGGVGTVHEAQQRSLDRRVALKVLHEAFAASPTALARFRREANTLARLDHPGIVRVFAVGEDGGHPWLAMEFIEGESLAQQLDRLRADGGHRAGSLRHLVESIAGIARALQHAHEAGVVHRDVKPSNILLRPDGSAVLGDFGLARDVEAPSVTQAGVIAGTPHYMAPEQVLGRTSDCDARTDVFALGATLYEGVTLTHAFEGKDSQEVLHAVLTRDPVDPRRRQRGLPTDLAAIIAKALEKDPQARYPSAGAFADDLQAFLELRPVSAHPPSRTRRLLRLARRQPLIAVLVLLGSVTMLLGAGLVWQLPTIRAAATARADSDYEDALLAGLQARTGSDAGTCYAHLRRALALQPARSEAKAGLCISRMYFEGPAAGLAELDRLAPEGDGQDLGRCRALLLRRLQRTDEAAALEQRLGPPATPMALWLAAVPLTADVENRTDLLEASRMLSLAIRIAPRPQLLFHTQWAVLQIALEDPGQRRESAEALLRLWPDHPVALQIAATNLLQLDPTRSLALLQRALALGLEDPLANMNLGVAQAFVGKRQQALETFEATLARPGLSEANRVRLVQIVRQLGDQEVEVRMANGWLQRDPRSLGARQAVARIASRDHDHERALALLRECVADAPRDVLLRCDLALALLMAGDAAASSEVLVALVAEQPTHERVHDQLLDVLEELQDRAGGLAECQRWIEVRGDDAQAWRALAEALLRCDAADAADRALAAAERADYLARGQDRAILLLHADALDRLGHADEANRLRARPFPARK